MADIDARRCHLLSVVEYKNAFLQRGRQDCKLIWPTMGSFQHTSYGDVFPTWYISNTCFVLFKSLQIITGLQLQFLPATLDIIGHFLSGSSDVYDALHKAKWLSTVLNFYQLSSHLAPKKNSPIWSAITLAFSLPKWHSSGSVPYYGSTFFHYLGAYSSIYSIILANQQREKPMLTVLFNMALGLHLSYSIV